MKVQTTVLRTRDPVLLRPLDPGWKNPNPGSGMIILDLNFENLVSVFGVKN
jgi:hypothetical protein